MIKKTLTKLVPVLFGAMAVMTLTPDEWLSKIASWLGYLHLQESQVQIPLASFILGILIALLLSKRKTSSALIIGKGLMTQLFKKAVTSGLYSKVNFFGYTNETAPDFLKYELLYSKGIQLCILNRDWNVEQADEEAHNKKISDFSLRPWNKSKAIKHFFKQPWGYQVQRFLRHYPSHPFVKGVILTGPKSQEAFISFYDWQEIPINGGSQFKGEPNAYLHIKSNTLQEEEFLHRLDSQFQYLWKHASKEKEDGET